MTGEKAGQPTQRGFRSGVVAGRERATDIAGQVEEHIMLVHELGDRAHTPATAVLTHGTSPFSPMVKLDHQLAIGPGT